jgi:hypothetical protein
MPGRAYPPTSLLRHPERWQVLPPQRPQETARLRLGPEDAPWPVLLVSDAAPPAGEDAFAALSLVDPEAPGLPPGMERLLPLASGPCTGLPPREKGVERMRRAMADSLGAPARRRIAAAQALAEAAAAALPCGQAWRLHGTRLRAENGAHDLGLRPLALPPHLLDGLFVWTDPATDDGAWPLPWRGAALGGVRGIAGPASAHRRAMLRATAEARLAACLEPARVRQALDALD